MVPNNVATKQNRPKQRKLHWCSFLHHRAKWSQSLLLACNTWLKKKKKKLQTKAPSSNTQTLKEMLIFGQEIFLDHITSSLRRMRKAACGYQQRWGGCSWQKGLKVEFPPGEHPLLCKRKLNYVIMGLGCWAHELSIHHHLCWQHLGATEKSVLPSCQSVSTANCFPQSLCSAFFFLEPILSVMFVRSHSHPCWLQVSERCPISQVLKRGQAFKEKEAHTDTTEQKWTKPQYGFYYTKGGGRGQPAEKPLLKMHTCTRCGHTLL